MGVTKPTPVTTTRRVNTYAPSPENDKACVIVTGFSQDCFLSPTVPSYQPLATFCVDRCSCKRRAHSEFSRRLRPEFQSQTLLQNASPVRLYPVSQRRGHR